jgi:hypothetical protein
VFCLTFFGHFAVFSRDELFSKGHIKPTFEILTS